MVTSGDSPPLQERRALCLELDSSSEAPALARAALAGFFSGSGLAPRRLETLTLLVSELVSNAVLHSAAPAGSEIALRVQWLDGDAIRVEVIDRGNGFVAGRRDRVPDGGGYGLYIVERQATRWGVDREGGTRVWFELRRGSR